MSETAWPLDRVEKTEQRPQTTEPEPLTTAPSPSPPPSSPPMPERIVLLDDPRVPTPAGTLEGKLPQIARGLGAQGQAVLLGDQGVGRLLGVEEQGDSVGYRLALPDGSTRLVEADQVTIPKTLPVTARLDTQAFLPARRRIAETLIDTPRLNEDNWEVSGQALGYNCIAHTLGKEKAWEWPGSRLSDFDRLYGEHGFVPVDGLDFRLQEGIEKVVLFAVTPQHGGSYEMMRDLEEKGHKTYDPGLICTHAILQEADGAFSSKNGSNEQIRFLDPHAMGGGLFGDPVRVYARQRDPSTTRTELRKPLGG